MSAITTETVRCISGSREAVPRVPSDVQSTINILTPEYHVDR